MNPTSVLIGKKVTVYSRLGDVEKQDVGILEVVEGDWIRLKKADGETMFFTIANVRMLKPFDHIAS
jgi:hypothetical protein